jgi:hypothetical protein
MNDTGTYSINFSEDHFEKILLKKSNHEATLLLVSSLLFLALFGGTGADASVDTSMDTSVDTSVDTSSVNTSPRGYVG